MKNLKECPFCGGKVNSYIGLLGIRLYKCEGCGATVSFNNVECNSSPERTDEYWNRRKIQS